MPFTGQYYGGKRRFYISRAPDAGQTAALWGAAAQTLTGVLNPMEGSEMVGPPNRILLDNANSAQGQGEFATELALGAEDHQGSPRFWLTQEAAGRFISSAFGEDNKTDHGTGVGYQHAMGITDSPVAFTVEEHLNGPADTTTSWSMAGCWVKSFTIDVTPGQQFATISPNIIASKRIAAGTSQTELDVTNKATTWPDVPGIPPTKCGLFLASTTSSNHTSAFDGSITLPTVAGTISDDLGSEINVGQRARSFSITYDTGVDLNQLYQAGMSSGSGFHRGKPYAVQRSMRLTVTFDIDSSTDDFLMYLINFTATSQQSYTWQFYAVTDHTVGGADKYGGISILCNAAVVDGIVRPSGDLGPATASVTFRGIQPAYSGVINLPAEYMCYAWTWDDINQDYA